MAISADVKSQLFRQSSSSEGEKLIRLPHESDVSASHSATGAASPQNASNGKAWTREEHERFLEGLELFPSGPWKEVAAFVGTRTTRQTMTHAQKYREKIARRKRGLRGSASAQQRASLPLTRTPAAPAPTAAPTAAPTMIAPLRQPQLHASVASTVTFETLQQQQQQQQYQALKHVQTSPTSVSKLEDPLDFGGCFMELDPEHFHYMSVSSSSSSSSALSPLDFALDQTLLVALAASEGDYQQTHQLSLSDEEMDLIMDSVLTSPPSSSSSSTSELQSALSFVC